MITRNTVNNPVFDQAKERTQILNLFRRLLSVHKPNPEKEKEDRQMVRKAFKLALDAHKNMRRKSGEPYIIHPIGVAIICAEEIGLGTTSIVCALLHDVVEDRNDLYTFDDIRRMFNDKVASICEGLTKIKEIFDHTDASDQAAHYKKLLVTMSDDVRVILIKLADRLHNMRTLEYMRPDKQLKIAAETTFLFAPLAHRLGLYAIKSELEDLSLKFTEPIIYNEISRRLTESDHIREGFANEFLYPIKRDLADKGFGSRILVRNKSISSIWAKMKKKQIPFDEVYDVFAIRIILDVPQKDENAACWATYSIVVDHYKPKPDRMRDWISIPRANGYQALHATVMSQIGKWVEVQIRTERMDDVAEKGYAAHWKYKHHQYDDRNVENWLDRIRDMLQQTDRDALDFLDDVQGYLFQQEVFIFTPKGELRILPAGSTVLDFAYGLHPDIGNTCIGANVNHKLKPRYYQLKSGDQIEILTSKKQEPEDDWLDLVKTSRAKSKIKEFLKEKKMARFVEGRSKLQKYFESAEVEFSDANIEEFVKNSGYSFDFELYYDLAVHKLTDKTVRQLMHNESRSWFSYINPFSKPKTVTNTSLTEEVIKQLRKKSDLVLLNKEFENIKYHIAPCCNPIPGDDVMGYIDKSKGIVIHRSQCGEAIELMSTFGKNTVKVKWTENSKLGVLAGIRISSLDKKGLMLEITQIISSEMDINIKSVNFESDGGVSGGIIMLYVNNTLQLQNLMNKIKKLEGVKKVMRIDNYSESEG